MQSGWMIQVGSQRRDVHLHLDCSAVRLTGGRAVAGDVKVNEDTLVVLFFCQ
jgi:hypothetical protein